MAENVRDGVLSPVSSADSKKSRSSASDYRAFERLSVSSVQYFAESLGYDTHYRKLFTIISSDALCVLTEDVNYRLREIAHKAVLFMRQRRGEKLTVKDVNEALKWSGYQKLLGHRSREPPRLHFLKELNLFVPNEGVVDVEALALANSSVRTDNTPVLTGRMLPSFNQKSGLIGSNIAGPVDDQLRTSCCNLLERCITCSISDLNKCLETLKQAIGLDHRCALTLLSATITLITQSPTNMRIWHCLRHVITYSDISRSIDGLQMITELNAMLTEWIFNPSDHRGTTLLITEMGCRLLALIVSKYDFLSSSRLDQYLLSQLQRSTPSPQLLFGLFAMVDIHVIFASLDLIAIQFEHFASDESSDNQELYFAWKRIIQAVLQHYLTHSTPMPTPIEATILGLFRVASQVFGDGLILSVPFIDSSVIETTPVIAHSMIPAPDGISETVGNASGPMKAGDELLEKYWNFAEEGIIGADDSNPTELLSTSRPIPAQSRRRKRRRETSDVFECPKRFRMMYQRDIIFVFHHTPAVVRPVVTKSVSSGDYVNKSNIIDKKANAIWAAIARRRKKAHVTRSTRIPSPVDVLGILL